VHRRHDLLLRLAAALTGAACQIAPEPAPVAVDPDCATGTHEVTQGPERFCARGEDGLEVRHGELLRTYPGGGVQLRTSYRDGVEDGTRVTWYEDGSRWAEVEVAGGARNGRARGWHSNGQPRSDGQERDDRPCGALRRWNEDGEPVPAEREYAILFGCTVTATGADCPPCSEAASTP
jgi:hypothetical protein